MCEFKTKQYCKMVKYQKKKKIAACEVQDYILKANV